jgi:hypothetical protein
MQAITVEYLMTLGVCWREPALREAAKLWPPCPSWSWWLGDRLAAMTRKQAMLRLGVAVAHIGKQELRVPGIARLGQLPHLSVKSSDETFAALCCSLGLWLDAPTDAEKTSRLGAAVEQLRAAAVTP